MPDEFEKEMQERMQNFRISPGPQVWKQVEAALPEEKRKRRFAFWWWLPLGLFIGGGIWYAVGGNKTTTIAGNQQPVQDTEQINRFKKAKDNVTTASPVTVPEQKNQAIKNVDAGNNAVPKAMNEDAETSNEVPQTKNKVAVKSKIVPETTNEAVATSNEVPQTKNKVVMKSKTVPETTNEAVATSNEVPQIKNKVAVRSKTVAETINEATIKSNDVLQTNNKVDVSNNPVKDDEPPVLQSAATKPNGNTSKNALNTTDAAANAFSEIAVVNTAATNIQTTADTVASAASGADKTPQSSAQNKKTKLASWQFFATAGTSNAEDKLFGSMEKSLSFASNLSQGTTMLDASPSQPTAGFSYAIGTERLQTINKYWQWYAAVQYGFISNHQKTGPRKDSSIAIYDNSGFNNSSGSRSTTVSGFYYTGSTASHTNTIHQLGLQTGLRYVINPLGKHPLSIRSGINVNQQFATNQLLYDSYRNAYYYSKAATRHFTTGMSLGFDWILAQKLTVGAFFLYNFTTINKLEAGSNLHWRSGGIRLAIPLRKK